MVKLDRQQYTAQDPVAQEIIALSLANCLSISTLPPPLAPYDKITDCQSVMRASSLMMLFIRYLSLYILRSIAADGSSAFLPLPLFNTPFSISGVFKSPLDSFDGTGTQTVYLSQKISCSSVMKGIEKGLPVCEQLGRILCRQIGIGAIMKIQNVQYA